MLLTARQSLLSRGASLLRRWPQRRRGTFDALTVVTLGPQCRVARVEPGSDGSLRLAAAATGSEADLPAWAALFAGSRAVLVLSTDQRHLLTLDRPDVPDAELTLAVRWPLGDALEVEPDDLLTTALPLPRINDSLRPQVLAVAARLDLVRRQLATLARAGIEPRHVDIADTALRGIALLQPPNDDGWVVVSLMGGGVAIGLLWQGKLCAMRSLPLAARRMPLDPELDGEVALHVQRTVDHFERQTTAMAIRHVLAAAPSWPVNAREALRAELPLQARLFELGDAMETDAAARASCVADDDLCALACVAAARFLDAHPEYRPQTAIAGPRPTAAEAAAAALATAAASAAATAAEPLELSA